MLTDINMKGKTVLLRADFNVPLDEFGNITDDTRIFEELPTIRYILKQGAKLIICSHLGRPKGEFDQTYSMFPVAQQLIKYLINKVHFAVDVVGPDAIQKAKNLKEGEVLVLENLRFHKEEEANDLYFAKKLASLADIYIDDAFGTIHRKHASIHRVAKLLPNNGMGFLMGKEINTIEKAMQNPDRPFVAILGGAKVADKIGVVKNLMEKADSVLIGGAMSFTFLKAQGVNVGTSIVDEKSLELAKGILEKAKEKGKKLILPVDVAVSTNYSPNSKARFCKIENIPENYMGLDIGPRTIKIFKQKIKEAKTIIWNGPMGVFEFPEFAAGTYQVAKAISKNKGLTIVGGGDTVAAVKLYKLSKKISHISTGGGATLALLEGAELPGYDALTDV